MLRMENKRNTLIVIVVLLLIFTPLTVISNFIRLGSNPMDENPKHKFYYNDYLWFYDENDELLGKYHCNTSLCEISKTTLDDEQYGLNYYQDGTKEIVSIPGQKFTFITDGVVINLFSITTSSTLQRYKSLKDYHTNLENNAFIIENNDNKWGVLAVNDHISSILPFEYDYISIKKQEVLDGYLSTKEFITLKNDLWSLVDNTNKVLTKGVSNPIIDYDDKYLVTKDDDRYKIYNYDGELLLSNYNISRYIFSNNVYGIIMNNYLYIFNNLESIPLKNIYLENVNSEIELEQINNQITIKIDGIFEENIAINQVF